MVSRRDHDGDGRDVKRRDCRRSNLLAIMRIDNALKADGICCKFPDTPCLELNDYCSRKCRMDDRDVAWLGVNLPQGEGSWLLD